MRFIYVIGIRGRDYRYPSIKNLFGKVLKEDEIFPGQLVIQFFTDRQKEMGWLSFTDNVYPEDIRPATKEEIATNLLRMGIEIGDIKIHNYDRYQNGE